MQFQIREVMLVTAAVGMACAWSRGPESTTGVVAAAVFGGIVARLATQHPTGWIVGVSYGLAVTATWLFVAIVLLACLGVNAYLYANRSVGRKQDFASSISPFFVYGWRPPKHLTIATRYGVDHGIPGHALQIGLSRGGKTMANALRI